MDDLIRRQDAADFLCDWCGICSKEKRNIMECDDIAPNFAKIPSSQQWIPVKWKPLNDLEREEWEDQLGYKLSDEEVKFGEADFKLPDDGDDIWVCTKSGIVDGDIFYNDNGMITLEYADITDIVAWMPKTEPEPYKEEK